MHLVCGDVEPLRLLWDDYRPNDFAADQATGAAWAMRPWEYQRSGPGVGIGIALAPELGQRAAPLLAAAMTRWRRYTRLFDRA